MQKVIRAYKQENIEMAYQPIKELKSGKSGIVSMAKNMGSKTIGEGVETEEEKELLIEFDIDYGQGYYFGKPG